MSYVKKIENLLEALKTGKIGKEQCGIESAQVIANSAEDLSIGEYSAVEQELNRAGASMYEETFERMVVRTTIEESDTWVNTSVAIGNNEAITFQYKEHPLFCGESLRTFKRDAVEIRRYGIKAGVKVFIQDGFYKNYVKILKVETV